ncbi:AAA family ATPase [Vibrio parahaemolyticus]|uniref:AAA family ATPase n=1 Tax=Vibrio parahaemolyticus TaxID=670 RepID=UPI00226A85EE|nr:AAA family ATPase [Vibrio parahaemolyticus]MCX8755556.1 AAA family ATPase [Vibrio parahaemolyticus]
MKKLKSIEVLGFQASNRSAFVKFSDDQVSIIHGDNGCGKTTFLKILHAVLSRNTSILLQEKVQKVTITCINNNDEEEVISIPKVHNMDDNSEKFDFQELNNSCLDESTSLSLGVERGMSKQSLKVDHQDIMRFLGHPRYRQLRNIIDYRDFSEQFSSYIRNINARKYRHSRSELSLDKPHVFLQSIKMDNIESLLVDRYRFAKSVASDRIQNALFETLSLVISPTDTHGVPDVSIPNDFCKLVIDNQERLIEALNDGFENNFKTQVVSILNEVNTDKDAEKLKENNLLSQLIINMIRELEVEKQLLSSVTTLVDTFNQYLVEGKKLLVNNNDIFIQLEDKKSHHSLDYLSSGERHIFTFLSLIVVAGSNKDFLIIDEPEISLNIKWQRTLMQLMRDLVPNTQIIVASHSPTIGKKSPQSLVNLKPEIYTQPFDSYEESEFLKDFEL